MRKFLFLFTLFSSLYHFAFSQSFEVVPIHESGPKSSFINYVFLGDGYQAHELDKYIEDVTKIVNLLKERSPYKEYKNSFNFYAIKVPSNVSGAALYPDNLIDNYFGSTFHYMYNMQRLLAPKRSSKVYDVLKASFPEYDQIILVVNDDMYGGSGGTIATCSTNGSSAEIAIHEIGHSFANLADEYYAGDYYAREKANMTKDTNPETIKWKHWIADGKAGIHSHGGGEVQRQWHKPATNCDMQYLGAQFCSVCKETFVEKFHRLRKPILSYLPINTEQTIELYGNDQASFELELLENEQNSLQIEWSIDGTPIDNTSLNAILGADNLLDGTHTLKAKVVNTTALVRRIELLDSVSWKINKTSFSVAYDESMCTDDLTNNFTIGTNSLISDFEFSIDSTNFQSSPIFENIALGTYMLYVKKVSSQVIVERIAVEIKAPQALEINTTLTHFTDEQKGMIEIIKTDQLTGAQTRLNNQGDFADIFTYTNLDAGNYTLEIKQANGCISSTEITILDQSIKFEAEITHNTCFGYQEGKIVVHSEKEDLTDFMYTIDSVYQNSPLFENLASRNYTLSIKRISDNQVITQIACKVESPKAPNVKLQPHHITNMSKGSLQITINEPNQTIQTRLNGEGTFSNTLVYKELEAGTYTLEIMQENGCVSTSKFTITDRSIKFVSTIDYELEGQNSKVSISCFSILANIAHYEFSLDGKSFQALPVFENFASGDYTIYVRKINTTAIFAEIPITIIEPITVLESIKVKPATAYSLGEVEYITNKAVTTRLDSAATFDTQLHYTGLTAGMHTLEVKNFQENVIRIDFEIPDFSHITDSDELLEKIVLYPNPFNDFIQIKNISEIITISITDIEGRRLKTWNNHVTNIRTLDLTELRAGTYIISFQMKSGKQVSKKIIKK